MIRHICVAFLALALAATPAFANDLGNATWSETDSSNNSASPNGWTSGVMLPSQVEPTARAMMGAIKRFYNHITPTVTAGGTANVLTLTYAVAPASYARECFRFLPSLGNSSSVTINVNGLGAKTVQAGGANLAGGEFVVGQIVTVCYDGTNFQLVGNVADTGVWINYTPLAACGSVGHAYGAYTSGGRYKLMGKTLHFTALINITNQGTCDSGDVVIITMPTGFSGNAGPGWICPGFYTYLGGTFSTSATVLPNTNAAIIKKADSTVPAAPLGESWSLSCTVEIQ